MTNVSTLGFNRSSRVIGWNENTEVELRTTSIVRTHPLFFTALILAAILSVRIGQAYLALLAVCLMTLFGGSELQLLSLILLFMRGVLNPGIAVEVGPYSALKLLAIIVLSLALIYKGLKTSAEDGAIAKELGSITVALLFVTCFVVAQSLFFSSYPLVSLVKWFSYALPFLGCVSGALITNRHFDCLEFLYKLFMFSFVVSIPLVFHPLGYLRNGYAFQGVFNQPNMFGILSVCFLAIVLTVIERQGVNLPRICAAGLAFFLELLSGSRTGLLGMLFCTFVFLLRGRRLSKGAYACLFGAMSFILFCGLFGLLDVPLQMMSERFIQFLSKGSEGININSRMNQIGSLLYSWHESPLFGTGFMVPYSGGIQNWSFSLDLVVEPGNIFLALLAYTGTIGLIVFIVYFVFLVSRCKHGQICLMMAPFVISMGEMTFFSTNNCGILCYLLISLAIAGDYGKLEESEAS